MAFLVYLGKNEKNLFICKYFLNIDEIDVIKNNDIPLFKLSYKLLYNNASIVCGYTATPKYIIKENKYDIVKLKLDKNYKGFEYLKLNEIEIKNEDIMKISQGAPLAKKKIIKMEYFYNIYDQLLKKNEFVILHNTTYYIKEQEQIAINLSKR